MRNDLSGEAGEGPVISGATGVNSHGYGWGEITPSEQIAIPTWITAFTDAVKAYTEYEEAVSRLALEEDKAAGDRIELERERQVLLAGTDPAAMGKNEEQRKAWLFRATESHTLQYQARVRSVELLKAEAEIARIRCRRSDMTLRYLELRYRMACEDGQGVDGNAAEVGP